jgi:tetratricopeptide (TPR) repeat protein
VTVYILILLVANWPSPNLRVVASSAVDYHNLGSIAALRGMQPEALEYYTRALMIDDSHKETRIGLADALWSLGSFDEARKEYNRAGVKPPDEFSGSPLDSLMIELNDLIAAGDTLGALTLTESKVPEDEVVPTEILEIKAKLQFWEKQYGKAYQTVMQAHAIEPSSPVWLYLAADYILETGDGFHSDSLYQEAIRLYPAFAPARIGRAFLAVEMGNIDIARHELSELQRIAIPEDTVKAQVDSLQKLLNYMGGNH